MITSRILLSFMSSTSKSEKNLDLNRGDQSTITAEAEKAHHQLTAALPYYKEESIKNSEKSLRGEETGHQFQSITSTQLVR